MKTIKMATPIKETAPILSHKIPMAIPIGIGKTIKKVETQGQNQFLLNQYPTWK